MSLSAHTGAAGSSQPTPRPAPARSYWQRRPGNRDAPGPASAPLPAMSAIVIVGGGLAGLATAVRILEAAPGAEVVVIEAEFVGYGASGRNGGLLSPLPAPIWLVTAARSAEHAWGVRRLNAEVRAAAGWLGREMPESEIGEQRLEIEASGRLTTAALAEVLRALDAAGIEHRLVANTKIRGARSLVMAAHTVHPFRLVRALAARARQLGALIVDNTRVLAIDPDGGGSRLLLDDGRQLRAATAVVSTNAYTPGLRLPIKIGGKPVHNYMAAIPLPDATPAKLVTPGVFTVELNKAYVFYREHGGHILYGGIEKLRQRGGGDTGMPADVLHKLKDCLARSFPDAGELAITETWGGTFHVTSTDLPIIRRVDGAGGLILNVGYGGTGVALTLACSRLVATLALGRALTDEDHRLLTLIQRTRIPVAAGLGMLSRIGWRVLAGGSA